ncbi:MAG: hypothetical protein LUG91_10240 [Ruminococcus sp.]|nr:hypothetical protein [Ruminococcus sp.]
MAALLKHIWANRGWTPNELHQKYGKTLPKTICFGSGLQQAFANGDIDKNEMIEKLKAMGISVEGEIAVAGAFHSIF